MSRARAGCTRGCLCAPIYDRVTEPLERGVLADRRARLLGDLTGVILDVGAGTGANLNYFRGATRVIATEPDPRMRKQLARCQDLITPIWSRLIPGCHPNREIGAAIRNAGFVCDDAERFDPFPRWVPTRPMLQATAAKPAGEGG